jgi:hypothetical protein
MPRHKSPTLPSLALYVRIVAVFGLLSRYSERLLRYFGFLGIRTFASPAFSILLLVIPCVLARESGFFSLY